MSVFQELSNLEDKICERTDFKESLIYDIDHSTQYESSIFGVSRSTSSQSFSTISSDRSDSFSRDRS